MFPTRTHDGNNTDYIQQAVKNKNLENLLTPPRPMPHKRDNDEGRRTGLDREETDERA